MNLLSGVTWKGAKLRIGEAKPDFRERCGYATCIYIMHSNINPLCAGLKRSVLTLLGSHQRNAAAFRAVYKASTPQTCPLSLQKTSLPVQAGALLRPVA